MRIFLRLVSRPKLGGARRDALVLYPAPRLLVERSSRLAELLGNLAAALAPSRVTPAMLEGFKVPLRRGSMRPRSLASSWLFHLAALVVLGNLLPLLGQPSAEELAALRKQKITWYYYDHELPAISPEAPDGREKPSERGGQPPAASPLGVTARTSRQVITSNPPRPDNARQTIVQPESPNIRISEDVPLPNVVMWASQPQKPTLQYLLAPKVRAQQAPRLLLPTDIAPLRPPVDLARRDLSKLKLPQLGVAAIKPPVPEMPNPVPEVPNMERPTSDLKIAASEALVQKPQLAVPPATTAPVTQAKPESAASERSAPPSPPQLASAGNSGALERLIALGIDPAPPSGEISVPPGNRAGSFSIGPSGKVPGTPAGSPAGLEGGGAGGPAPAGEGTGQGPARQLADIRVPGISISGGIQPPSASLGPIVSGPPPSPPPPPAPPTPAPARPANPNVIAALVARATRPTVGLPEWGTGDRRAAQGFLYSKRVYTVYINMPNLSSQSGSWIMRFSELGAPVPRVNEPELTAPVALRKVDPGYDPGAVREGVEGTVVLYAVIHQDGKVDSVRVVRSLHPRLDENAVQALLRWQFRPATRDGHPVKLEALVQIPFTLGPKPF